MNRKSREIEPNGFTLIELMIVIAIIGVLVGVGLPFYGNYIKETHRTDGMSELTRVMQQQEKYYLNSMTYVTDLSLLGLGATGGKYRSAEGYYDIIASTCPGVSIGRCVLLTAEPIGSQAGDGTFTLNSRGERDWTGNNSARKGWP